MSLIRPSPNRLASSMPSALTDGCTSVARTKPRPPALTAEMMSSTEPRWTFEPSATPAAVARTSASSAGIMMVGNLSVEPWSAALTSAMGIAVRVSQKLMTGTKGIETSPAGGVGVGGGGQHGLGGGEPEGVGVGVPGEGWAEAVGVVGGIVAFDVPTEV